MPKDRSARVQKLVIDCLGTNCTKDVFFKRDKKEIGGQLVLRLRGQKLKFTPSPSPTDFSSDPRVEWIS